jgi:hypothetical protein
MTVAAPLGRDVDQRGRTIYKKRHTELSFRKYSALSKVEMKQGGVIASANNLVGTIRYETCGGTDLKNLASAQESCTDNIETHTVVLRLHPLNAFRCQVHYTHGPTIHSEYKSFLVLTNRYLKVSSQKDHGRCAVVRASFTTSPSFASSWMMADAFS